MGINTWYVGDTVPLLTIQLVPDSGFIDLTGLAPANFTLLIRNLNVGETSGVGTFSSVTQATVTNGVVTAPASVKYQFAVSEAVVGLYHLYVRIQFASGQQTFDAGLWQVGTA